MSTINIPVCVIKELPFSNVMGNSIANTPEAAAEIFRNYMNEDYVPNGVENMMVMSLDVKNKPISIQSVSIGHLSGTTATQREIFRMAILQNAASIILCHNHPSGDVTPSSADLSTTRNLVKASEVLDIKMLDHVIISTKDKKYISLRESGLVNF